MRAGKVGLLGMWCAVACYSPQAFGQYGLGGHSTLSPIRYHAAATPPKEISPLPPVEHEQLPAPRQAAPQHGYRAPAPYYEHGHGHEGSGSYSGSGYDYAEGSSDDYYGSCGGNSGYGSSAYGYGGGQEAWCYDRSDAWPDGAYAGQRVGVFASAAGLVMNRDDENPYRFSYFDTAEEIQLSSTHDAEMEFSGGAEFRFGYYFGCGAYAWEAVYWGVFPGTESSTLLGSADPGNLNGILNWDQLDYNGDTGDWWVDNAFAHRVSRSYEFHNVEINLLGFSQTACGNRLDLNWRVGARYFQFSELLQFAADNTNTAFTGAANELYYNIDVENNLMGFQFGGDGQLCVRRGVYLTSSLAAGLFANHISHRSTIGGAAGYAMVNNGPFNGRTFNIQSSKDDIALLVQMDLGIRWDINCCWSVGLGYRAVGITGVALPSNQIYSDLRGLNDVAEIDSNGSLILHGGYLNVEYNY